MRLSIDKRDHAYRSSTRCAKYRVFLNGTELFDCVTADEEKGFVIRQVVNRHPVTRQPVIGRTGILKGTVAIVLKVPGQTIVSDELADLKPVAAPAEQPLTEGNS